MTIEAFTQDAISQMSQGLLQVLLAYAAPILLVIGAIILFLYFESTRKIIISFIITFVIITVFVESAGSYAEIILNWINIIWEEVFKFLILFITKYSDYAIYINYILGMLLAIEFINYEMLIIKGVIE